MHSCFGILVGVVLGAVLWAMIFVGFFGVSRAGHLIDLGLLFVALSYLAFRTGKAVFR